jgi:hypothetical protein
MPISWTQHLVDESLMTAIQCFELPNPSFYFWMIAVPSLAKGNNIPNSVELTLLSAKMISTQ